MKTYDVNKNTLPQEFDELVSTDQPVVYWWKNGTKSYKIMPSIDEAIQAIDRANAKNYPAYSVATIKKGRMVMNVSFYGVLKKYGDKDRYFLGTNGAHLWWCEKQNSKTTDSHDIDGLINAFQKHFAQEKQNERKQEKQKDEIEPYWMIAFKERFPNLNVQVWPSGNGVYVLDGDLTFEDNIYTYTVMYRDETYPREIDGRCTDKWIEIYKFNLTDLKESTFEDSLDLIDYEEQIV